MSGLRCSSLERGLQRGHTEEDEENYCRVVRGGAAKCMRVAGS